MEEGQPDAGVGQQLGDVLQSGADGDDEFEPVRELEGVAHQKTADGVAVVGPVVLGLAESVDDDEAHRRHARLRPPPSSSATPLPHFEL